MADIIIQVVEIEAVDGGNVKISGIAKTSDMPFNADSVFWNVITTYSVVDNLVNQAIKDAAVSAAAAAGHIVMALDRKLIFGAGISVT